MKNSMLARLRSLRARELENARLLLARQVLDLQRTRQLALSAQESVRDHRRQAHDALLLSERLLPSAHQRAAQEGELAYQSLVKLQEEMEQRLASCESACAAARKQARQVEMLHASEQAAQRKEQELKEQSSLDSWFLLRSATAPVMKADRR